MKARIGSREEQAIIDRVVTFCMVGLGIAGGVFVYALTMV